MLGIQLEGLEKRFGSIAAVDQLSFEVDEGDVFGLLGPNGAGKTTTIRMLACLISPTGGSAKVAGYTVTKEPTKVRERVGILTENPSLYERLTVHENMDFFAEAYGVSSETDRKQRIRELLEFFDLWDRKADRVAHLSKGMKQKLALARALIHRPPVLLLDEPTAGLDPESAKEVKQMVTELSRREKRAILLCTHRLEDAENLCTRLMIIERGRGIATGTPESLRDKVAGPPVLVVVLKSQTQSLAQAVKNIPLVDSLTTDGSKILITLHDPDSSIPEVVRAVVRAGADILSVNLLKPSLEDIYLKLVREAGS